MNVDHLVRMANQIAANFAAPHLGERGESVAITETTNHIAKFWDPRMKEAIFAAPRDGLSAIARAAVEQLAARN